MVPGSCLVCGSHFQVEAAHWPFAVGMGRSRKKHPELPTLPLCVRCHEFGQHMGSKRIIQTIIARAPAYWRSVGEWENARPYYERWLGLRAYKQSAARGI
jgi:hypothetical protein